MQERVRGLDEVLVAVPAGPSATSDCPSPASEPWLQSLAVLAELAECGHDPAAVAMASLAVLGQVGAEAAAVYQFAEGAPQLRLLAEWPDAGAAPCTEDDLPAATMGPKDTRSWGEGDEPVTTTEVALGARDQACLGVLRLRWAADVGERERGVLQVVAALLSLALERNRLVASLAEKDEQRGGLLARLTSAQEEERRKIARELHDEASQALTAVMLSLARAESATTSPAERVAAFADTRALATRALNDLRQVVFDLRPTQLDDLGLLPAVRGYIERVSARSGLRIELMAGPRRRLPRAVETALFRILQEAVTNVVRHAEATVVQVELDETESRLQMTIADDGRGFDPTAGGRVGHLGSLGLVGMRERAELIGATLRIESAPGRGTRIVVTLVLDEG